MLVFRLCFKVMISRVMRNCEIVTKERRKTAVICYQLLSNMCASVNVHDEVTVQELLLLAHRSNFQFPVISANGFFCPSYKLMLGLAANVTTYVIILLTVDY